MTQLAWSIGGFLVAIGLLVTVHEFGHFYVARRCGVRVLRFSIGFGRPLWRRVGRDGTEYVVAALPLGGYVRMLDEAEGDVPPDQLHAAFNRQPVGRRMAVVAAGPAANLLFAVLAYWLLFMTGVTGLRPDLGPVPPDSPAARSGFHTGDILQTVDGRTVQTWEEASLALLDAALAGVPVDVQVTRAGQPVALRFDPGPHAVAQEGNPLMALGLLPGMPPAAPIVGNVEAGSPAADAGFAVGDRILSTEGAPVPDWEAWVDRVRARPAQPIEVVVERAGQAVTLRVIPAAQTTPTGTVGRVGTALQPPPPDPARLVTRHFGPVEAAGAAVARTWEVSALTVHMLYRMVRGEAALENLSGPITIAEFAGASAQVGPNQFLAFLALVSVSLGLLNLLPIPVLDGGHLVYHAVELARGSPPSEKVRIIGQQGGLVLLLALTVLAIYNDLTRLFS